MEGRRFMLAILDQGDGREGWSGSRGIWCADCVGWFTHSRYSDEIIDGRALCGMVMRKIERRAVADDEGC